MRVLHEVTGLHREPSGLQFKDVRVPKFELNWHQHTEWELTYIVSGSGYRMVGGSIEAYFPGDLVLIGSGIPHSWVSSDATDDSARAIVLHASPERMAWFAQLSGAERFFQLTELAHRGNAFEVDDARALVDAAEDCGVDVTWSAYPEMPHIWMMSYPAFPEAVAGVEEFAAFVRRVTG